MRNKIYFKTNPDYSLRERATIITQTPMRVTLAGGGTDVIKYSHLRGGAWISAGINKYVFVFLNKTEDSNLIKASHGIEATMSNNFNDIPNPIIKECLKKTGVTKGIEISTAADASAKSGLGGSGAFEVGLLHALYSYKKEPINQLRLGEMAADIEINKLKRPVGPQDQYIAAVGGINYFEMDRNGNVSIEPLNLSLNSVAKLENNLLYFRTGIQRDAAAVLEDETKKISENDTSSKIIQNLDEIKALGKTAKSYLEKGHIDDYGQTLHQHWLIKKKLSSKVSTPQIDQWYDSAMKAGAVGGKIMGAGGGGWFVFYVPDHKATFRDKMRKTGLEERRVRFDFEGTKLLINLS